MDPLLTLKQFLCFIAAFWMSQSQLTWAIWEHHQLPRLDYSGPIPARYVYPTPVPYSSSRIAAPNAVPTPFVASKIQPVIVETPQVFSLVPAASQCTSFPTVTVTSFILVATASPVAVPTEIVLHSSTSLDIIASVASRSSGPFVIPFELHQILLLLFCCLVSRCFSGFDSYPATQLAKPSVEVFEMPVDLSKMELIVPIPTFEQYKVWYSDSIDPENPITILALMFEWFTYCRELGAALEGSVAFEPQEFQRQVRKVTSTPSIAADVDVPKLQEVVVKPIAVMVSMGINTETEEIVKETIVSSPFPQNLSLQTIASLDYASARLDEPYIKKSRIVPRGPRVPVAKARFVTMYDQGVQASPPAVVSMECSTDDLPRDNHSISTQTPAPPAPPTHQEMETQTPAPIAVACSAPSIISAPLPSPAEQTRLRWEFIRNITGRSQRVIPSIDDITDGFARLVISEQQEIVVELDESEESFSTSTTGNDSLASTASPSSAPATTPSSSPIKPVFLFGDSSIPQKSIWDSESDSTLSPATPIFDAPSKFSTTPSPLHYLPSVDEESVEKVVYGGADSKIVESSEEVMSFEELCSVGRELAKKRAVEASVSSSSAREPSASSVMSLDDLLVKGQQLSAKHTSAFSGIFVEGLSAPIPSSSTRKIASLRKPPSQRPTFPLPARPYSPLIPTIPPLNSSPTSLEPAPLETPILPLLSSESASAVEPSSPHQPIDTPPVIDSVALFIAPIDSSLLRRPTILQISSKSTSIVELVQSPSPTAQISSPPPLKPRAPTPAARRPRKLVKAKPSARP